LLLSFLFFFLPSRYVLVRMKSAAETGFCFNIRRLRLQEKLVLLRYDPIGKSLGKKILFSWGL
uniref:39S ribosomal protein L33, mitochondrial n=1 Tax=Falco tinnunculus TaxID=100819 RepID=A0A8C4UHK8_FALTI